jgi:hypothetical protein
MAVLSVFVRVSHISILEALDETALKLPLDGPPGRSYFM